jgi:DNA-directed RNA polymerase subunit omega
MLVKPPIEELLPKADSRYTLAMLVAKRTRQLVDGAQPMVPEDTPNLVTLACEEIMADKVVGIPGIHSPFVPLRPEIEEARRLAKELAENQAAMDVFPDIIDLTVAKVADAGVEDVEDGEIEILADEDIIDEVVSDEDDLIEEEIDDITVEDIADLAAIDAPETEEDK